MDVLLFHCLPKILFYLVTTCFWVLCVTAELCKLCSFCLFLKLFFSFREQSYPQPNALYLSPLLGKQFIERYRQPIGALPRSFIYVKAINHQLFLWISYFPSHQRIVGVTYRRQQLSLGVVPVDLGCGLMIGCLLGRHSIGGVASVGAGEASQPGHQL